MEMSEMEFLTIDVETANSSLESICQIGVCLYEDGVLVEEFSCLVDPEDHFDARNISIHKIDDRDVQGANKFLDVYQNLCSMMTGRVVVTHTGFDRTAIERACQKYQVTLPSCTWLDSSKVARRVWSQFSQKGYGLKSLCSFLGYEFNHHDALEDAKAAGEVIIAASQESGLDINSLLKLSHKPFINPHIYIENEVLRDGNPEGALFGDRITFTGKIGISREEAKRLAIELGCAVDKGVTKKTTIVVVGDQDLSRLAGKEKSAKHLKAEALIEKGVDIRIIGETDFLTLVQCSSS